MTYYRMRTRPSKKRERLQTAGYALVCVLVAAAGWMAVMFAASGAAGADPSAATTASPAVADAAATDATTSPGPAGFGDGRPIFIATPAVATPTPVPVATKAPYEIDLYRAGTFVSQTDREMCTAGAIQNMLNIIGPTIDLTTAKQQQISDMVVSMTTRDDSRNGGYGPNGWALSMPKLGGGNYKLVVESAFNAAMHDAAIALRKTNRPVGLLTWYGAHSWVMTGFRSDADPAVFPNNFRMSGAYIVDPFYPRLSTIWGQTWPPDSFRTSVAMAENWLGWKRPEGSYPGRDGNYLLVIPVDG